MLTNALTVDVEDYFQVSAFAPYIQRDSWGHWPVRVERNLDVILELFDSAQSKGTFFTLGWIADRHPQLVRRIADCGHEIASHGYSHLRATEQSPEQFAQDVARAKQLLEDITGRAVLGYRAPSFSIGHANMWALETLARAGYRYSSSIYPIKHDHYGMPDAPRFGFKPLTGESLLEFPATTIRMLNRNFPAAGGGYFRLLPYAVSRWMIRRVNQQDRAPCIFYFHPWELDPEQPRPRGINLKTRFRHYVNLAQMQPRLRKLLADFRWGRMDEIFLGMKG